MRAIYGYIPLIFVLTAGLTGLAFYRPITRWFKTNREMMIGAPIGAISHVEGSVRRLHGGDIELIPVNLEVAPLLRDGDTIQTGVYSVANLVLDGGNQVSVFQGSGVKFERWDPRDENSPLYIHVVFGTLGRGHDEQNSGRIFIIQDGKMLASDAKPVDDKFELLIKAPAIGVPVPADPPVFSSVSPVEGLNPETLTDEFIQETVRRSKHRFEKCWGAYQKGGTEKTQMHAEFDIGKNGQVENAKVSETKLKDEKLVACIREVVSKISFRPYLGELLHKSYVLNFE